MTRRTQGRTHFRTLLAVGATVATSAGFSQVQAQDAPAEITTDTATSSETTTMQTDGDFATGGNRGNGGKRNRNKNNRNNKNKNNRSRALPNTGGEPWLMAFGGLALAGSALLLRRKLDASQS